MTLYPQNDPVQMVRSLEVLIKARYQFFGHLLVATSSTPEFNNASAES